MWLDVFVTWRAQPHVIRIMCSYTVTDEGGPKTGGVRKFQTEAGNWVEIPSRSRVKSLTQGVEPCCTRSEQWEWSVATAEQWKDVLALIMFRWPTQRNLGHVVKCSKIATMESKAPWLFSVYLSLGGKPLDVSRANTTSNYRRGMLRGRIKHRLGLRPRSFIVILVRSFLAQSVISYGIQQFFVNTILGVFW